MREKEINWSLYDFEGLAKECVCKRISLAASEPEWFTLACSLASLGERGRGLFLSLASVSPEYKEKESDSLFSRVSKRGHKTAAKFLVMAKENGIDTSKYIRFENEGIKAPEVVKIEERTPTPEKPVFIIPFAYVSSSVSENSVFVKWLFDLFAYKGNERFKFVWGAIRDYWLGSTRAGDVIFWDIDKEWKVRAGKIMSYNSDGHRAKYPDGHGKVDSVHNRLAKIGVFDESNFSRSTEEEPVCFFGSHLIGKEGNEDKTLAVVESEKTAVICSLLFPRYIWIATSSQTYLTPKRSEVFRGRNVILIPDHDGVKAWKEAGAKIAGTCSHLEISDLWDKYRDDEYIKADIADLLIDDLKKKSFENLSKLNSERSKLFDMAKDNPAVCDLIEAFLLEIEL